MFDIFYSSGPRSASLDFTVDPLNGQDVFLNGMPEEMGETNQLSVNFGQDLNTQYEDAELSNSEELILLPFRPSSPRNVWAPMLNVTRIGQSLGDPEMLLSKYDKHTCAILSVRNGPNENPWRTVVWPLALESPALLYAISSLAAFHSAKKRPELKVQGLEHMRNSIRCLADTISYMKVETALATTLVLAFAESWDMHVSTGSHHLRGARSLVRKALSMARRPDILGLGARRAQFLCRAWLYMDVIARLTNVDEPDLDEIDAALWSSVQPRDTHEEIDPLMGCASTLFPLMGAAASLVTKVKKSMSTPINLISQASELKAALETWAPPPVFDDPEDPACDIQHSLQTAEAYRWATLLYLHQAFPELPSKSSTQLARKALVCLAVIPISSRTIIVHIFPLMAAGCEVKSKDDRDWVDERWQSMSQRLQIGNVDRCREVNREVWSRRDQVASPSSASFDFLNLETMMPTSPPQIDLDMQNPTTVEDSRALSPVQLNEPSARDTSTKTDMLDFSKSSDPGPLPLILDEEVMEDLPPNLADGMPGAMPDSAFDMLVDKNLLGSAVAHRPSLGMEFELSSSESSSLGVGVGTKPWSPVEADTLPFDQTVRGSAHWVGVMRDWNWEGTFLPLTPTAFG